MEVNIPLDVENTEDITTNMGYNPTSEKIEQEDIIKSLLESEEELKKSYKDFSLENELDNERFSELMANGVSMKDAYELCHIEDIYSARLEEAKKQWLAELKQNIIRPEEEALSNKNHGNFQPIMSKKQREELIRRAERGEIIRL